MRIFYIILALILSAVAAYSTVEIIKVKKTGIHKFITYKKLPTERLEMLDFIDDQVLSSGKAEMGKHKVVFTGITRDGGRKLPEAMRHMEYIGKFFADYRVIIFENDSTDATKMMLKIWSMINPKVKIISEDFHNKKRPSIKFLADARNRYLEAMRAKEYDGFDIVIPIDMDMKYGIDVRGIQDTFSKIDRWDMVCSNGIYTAEGNMYDAFAFRSEELPQGSSYEKVQRVYDPKSDLVPVHSCFNGLAIYKRKLFEGCKYDSIGGDCEHVYLHNCMRAKHDAKLFMNPTQVIRYRRCGIWPSWEELKSF